MSTRWSRTKLWLLALVPLLALVTGCTDAREGVELAVGFQLEPDPPSAGETLLTLVVRTADGAAVEGAEVRVEATMAHAGMVPEFVSCTEGSPGSYAGTFEFTMGGDWILIVDVTLADGRTAQSVLEVPRVAPRRSE